MLKVSTDQAKPKMVLASSIVDPEHPEHILLKSGFELDGDIISRLRSLKIRTIWIKYPGLDFLDDTIDPELIKQQQELYSTLKDDFTQAQEQGLKKIDYNQYTMYMNDLFNRILRDKDITGAFVSELQGIDNDIFLHCTRVASMAILTGIRLESHIVKSRPTVPASLAMNLIPLGVGCLLHDIGKIEMSDEMRNFHITGLDMGSKEWQTHTETGFEMIANGLDATAGQVIINHHQHYDGSGFPKRVTLSGSNEPNLALEGDAIHIFCRIACIANRFDGFRFLPDGTVAPTIVALKRLQNENYVKWFDPLVFKAFITAMPPFNLGEQLTLNNGQDVVVIELNETEPCKPIVRPIDMSMASDPEALASTETSTMNNEEGQEQGENKKSPEPDTPSDINLAARSDLHIAKCGDYDITPYLY